MATRFFKYHGLGNDFIVIDGLDGGRNVTPGEGEMLCDRHRGIGADGVLWLGPSDDAAAQLIITNADGSRAEMCGNGIRCVAKYLADRRGAEGAQIPVMTDAGRLGCEVFRGDDGLVDSVRVSMGAPRLDRSQIPMQGEGRFVDEDLSIDGQTFRATAVSMGNPHAIIFGDASRNLAEKLGPSLEHHSWFPHRTNAEFAAVRSRSEIDLVVWERGCGITQACGTGASATAVAAVLGGHADADTEVKVNLLGGPLFITVPKDLSNVWMRGPAAFVFEGDVELDLAS